MTPRNSDGGIEEKARIEKKRRAKYRGEKAGLVTSRTKNNQFPEGTFRTDRGEMVRSLGELAIANFLNREGLKYSYERPIRLGRHTIRPDFYLKRYDVYVEYWGMLDDPIYFRNYKWKVSQYRSFGIKIIQIQSEDLADLRKIFHSRLEQVRSGQ
jgi:hypothetical protein